MNRRTFLKLSGGTAAAARHDTLLPPVHRMFPSIPSLADLASARMPHTFMELFNRPIAMNDWGYAQAVKSVSAITAMAFPPYACCGIPDVPLSPGFLTTCELFVNDQFVALSDDPSQAVIYQWYPHCVVREQAVDGLRFRTTMFLPPQHRAVMQRIEIRNSSPHPQTVKLGFNMRAAVAQKSTAWFANLPGEGDNLISWNASHGRILWTAQHSQVSAAQGIHPPADVLAAGNLLEYHLSFAPGQHRELHYVCAIAPTAEEATAMHDRLQSGFAEMEARNEQRFEQLVRSACTPGASDFSGHLPRLHTASETLWNLWQNGLRNLLSARRCSPDSAYGPTWLTLNGHELPTLSFLWDTSLCSLSLALLDPQTMRNLVEIWFQRDMHQHFATDYITGEAVGQWYAVNDMAIIRCARDYLRITGDLQWLDKTLAGKPVIDHLLYHATYWKKLVGRHGLADYGGSPNLLEVVSTYTHEVAGMNAGNVSSMRFVANLLDHRGHSLDAQRLRSEATALANRINDVLYVRGKGWWRAGQPDGAFHEVRHCYDFLAVLGNMSEDISDRQKREMTDFFWKELASKKWMRALASGDPDATWDIRPDHSCLGAYAAWPPECAKALFRTEDPARIASWLTEVAKAGKQGPVGQAHFVEGVMPPLKGGAYKASNDAPYIEDWSVISGGAFIDMTIESIFGVTPSLYRGLSAAPKLAAFDKNARLEGLHYQGGEYTVSQAGVARSA